MGSVTFRDQPSVTFARRPPGVQVTSPGCCTTADRDVLSLSTRCIAAIHRSDPPRQPVSRTKGDERVLELAVLGLLHESPLHGYELRQRLKATLGTFRAFSYGSLYPTLRKMRDAGWIAEDEGDADVVAGAPALTGRRGKVVYKLTAEGKERLTELLAEAGPSAWEDETFGVHFALFSQTDPE